MKDVATHVCLCIAFSLICVENQPELFANLVSRGLQCETYKRCKIQGPIHAVR